jgi:hypothetical protein
MKINWDRWVKRDRGTLLFCGYAFLASAILFVYLDCTKVKVKSKEDLVFINGPFQNYSWIKYTKGSLLTFKLQNFNARFQIAADFYGILKREEFKNIPYGQNITTAIPKEDEHFLNSNNQLLAFSVASGKDTFLSLDDTIRKHNDYTFVIGVGLFILLGFIFIYFGYKSKIKTSIF